ncbi:MAG: hypothetical protein K0R29_1432 [Pseudobdellovibrio sp.]|jgi:hypothetical protein|nr:hypothetical protein [Pseudobdellovibrio sp.]
MKNEFAQTPFTIEITEDGSPTLRLQLPTGSDGESMHHSGGAAAETEYIYKSVIEIALRRLPDLKMAVVGLGLGYIEISWAIACLKQNKNLQSRFISFETDEGLKKNFLEWLNGSAHSIYSDVCKAMDANSSIENVKEIIRKNLAEEPKALRGDLISDYDRNNSYNLICFDAFSKKTSESLWTEEFLTGFLKQSAHQDCVFTTYACTGALKRALKNNGFTLIERFRFKSKRESTLAVRGIFTSETTFRIS